MKEFPFGVEHIDNAITALTKLSVHCAGLLEANDALAAKVAEWKARAEKAEAALKAAEDDRHLTTSCV